MGLALMIGLAATSVFGANSHEAKEKAARTACLAGDYTKGITLLSELFVATKDPNWIFNQARCFEQNSRYHEAISRFKEYLRVVKDPTGEEKANVQKHIADCQESLAEQTPSQAPSPVAAQPPVTPQPPPSIAAVAAETQPRVDVSTASGDSPSANRRTGLRVAGIATAAVGAAALATGIVLNIKVNSMASDLEIPENYSRSTESQRSSYATMAWVSYGVGAACLATGTALYVVGRNKTGESSTRVALLPTFGTDRASILLQGGY